MSNLTEIYVTRTISAKLISIGTQLRVIKSEFELIDIKDRDIVTVIQTRECIQNGCTKCTSGRVRFVIRNHEKKLGHSCFATLETLDGRLVVE